MTDPTPQRDVPAPRVPLDKPTAEREALERLARQQAEGAVAAPRRGQGPGSDGPALVSIMATRTREVELALSLITTGVLAVIGLFLCVAFVVALANGTSLPLPALGWSLGGLAVLVAVGWGGTLHGWRRGRRMMPWALIGSAAWLVAVLIAFNRINTAQVL